MIENAPPIVVQTGKQPRHCIIWLHGLGADGQDFVPIADELNLPVSVRHIFLHAPMRPVTINGGFVMRAWYDISGQSVDAQQDAAGICASQILLEELITRETANGIKHGQIFLAGFSQGGAVALHTAIRQKAPLGGVLALSTYLPLANSAVREATANTRTIPVFMAHGRNDSVIPYALGKASRDALLELGYAVEWHEYTMQHSMCDEEISDIETWLTLRMKRGIQ
jgi:phospholipase/carboxylesterase